METIKCISLWQPYASLVAIGAKRIETRSWSTNYRGPILIQASKRWDDDIAADCRRALDVLDRYGFISGGRHADVAGITWVQTLGKVLCRARLGDCRLMSTPPANTLDAEFGNFGPGRWGWMLESVEPVLPPVPVVGRQGLFEVPLKLIQGGILA